jgi:uncharacterized protein (DUF1800 family)
VRARSGELQPQTILDYLAVKRLPRGLTGWRVEPAITFDERLSRLVADAAHHNPDHRAYVGRALARAGEDLVAHPEVRACLERLADDREPAVREATEWWVGARAGTGQP